MRSLLLVGLLVWLAACNNSKQMDYKSFRTENDTLIHLEPIPSEYSDLREVDIWLPAGYGTIPGQHYKLLLMLNGKEVFQQDGVKGGWYTDAVMDSLLSRNLIMPTVVASIGLGKSGEAELIPFLEDRNGNPATLSEPLKQLLLGDSKTNRTSPNSNYIRSVAEEILPALQSKFLISKEARDITVLGGGKAALSAFKLFCKYPNLIGNAGCLSTEWNLPHAYAEVLLDLVPNWLPEPANRRLYFDYGTEGVDAQQKFWQQKVDAVLGERGYFRGRHFLTLEIRGAEPNPSYWSQRSHKPFQFLQRK